MTRTRGGDRQVTLRQRVKAILFGLVSLIGVFVVIAIGAVVAFVVYILCGFGRP